MDQLYLIFCFRNWRIYNVLIKLAWYNLYMSALEFTASYDEVLTNKVWDNGLSGIDGPESPENLYLHEINNVFFNKTSYPEFTREYSRTIGGPSFFVGIYESQFYHFMCDGIAQYLWLRTFIPEIKIYFVNDQPGAVDELAKTQKDFVSTVIQWCQEEGFGGEVINLCTYKKLKVDKLFLLANSNITFLREKISEISIPLLADVLNGSGSRLLMLPLLKEFIYKKALEHNRLPEDFNYPTRVFVRPGLTIERLQAWHDQIKYFEKNNVVFDKDLNIVSDPKGVAAEVINIDYWRHTIDLTNAGAMRGVMAELGERYLSPEEVLAIDNFFKRRDYFFLDSQELSWVDMLNMIIRAEKVALISGAAILNAIIAESSTQIVYLEPNTTYQFNHLETLDLFFKEVRPIIYYDQREVLRKKFDINRLLSDLEKEKGDFL